MIANAGAGNPNHRERARQSDDEKLLNRLHKAIKFYDPISIDNFLWHYSKDADFIARAKKEIAKIILKSGSDGYFSRDGIYGENGDKSNWYRFLWDALVSELTPEEIADPAKPFQFNIITFNYDSSLEYFLYTRVTKQGSMFDKTQQEAVLKKLKNRIHHVYGAVLKYKWMGGKEENNSFGIRGEVELSKMIDKYHDDILLINQRKQSEYKHLQDIIKEASQVIFLGFGFDDTNIGPEVLHLEETLKPKRSGLQGGIWTPVIKYTNYEDSRIIDKKFDSIFISHLGYLVPGFNTIVTKGERIINKSTRKVYQALELDFSLNNI